MIYAKNLVKLLGIGWDPDTRIKYYSANSPSMMPLVIERLHKNTYSIMHWYKQNGDVMRDPEIVFEYDPIGMVEVIEYRQDSLGIMNEVYEENEAGERVRVRTQLKADLNHFFGLWLKNIKDQGYTPNSRSDEET